MSPVVQHRSPHFQPITRNCSSISHFSHCGWILLSAVHFHGIHLLFLHYSAAGQMWHILEKSLTWTLWKSLQLELSQQFPASLSWQNVFIAVQQSLPMELLAIPELDRGCTNTHTAHKYTLWWEAGGQLQDTVTGNGCKEVIPPLGQATVRPTYCQRLHWQW